MSFAGEHGVVVCAARQVVPMSPGCCRRGQRPRSCCPAFACQGVCVFVAFHDTSLSVCRSSGSSVWESGRRLLCAMPFLSPYRFVSRRRRAAKVWVAQKRDRGLFREGFRTALAAATWIARELGLAVSDLRRRSVSGCQGDRRDSTSRFRGVSPHRGKWLARSPAREHCGTYASQEDAARALARFLKVPLASLRRAGASQRVLRQTFRAAYSVFRGYCPGDWLSLEEQEVKSACMFRKASKCEKTPLPRAIRSGCQGVGIVVVSDGVCIPSGHTRGIQTHGVLPVSLLV